MQVPLQIVYRDIAPSSAIETAVRERVDGLEKYFDRITSCRVVIASPHRRHHKGTLYHVRIELEVPTGALVVGRDPGDHHAHKDLYVAIRDSFRAAKRELSSYARRMRGEVKQQAGASYGQITQLFLPHGYGFLQGALGYDVYFHANSVVGGDFYTLEVGDEVRFQEEQGDEGPQASTVVPLKAVRRSSQPSP